jgi:hypothetical protein
MAALLASEEAAGEFVYTRIKSMLRNRLVGKIGDAEREPTATAWASETPQLAVLDEASQMRP